MKQEEWLCLADLCGVIVSKLTELFSSCA